MKILLDENLPCDLKIDMGNNFVVKSVRDMGWLGKKNGELLNLLDVEMFDVFITVDKNIIHQQNLEKYNVSIFIIRSENNRRDTIKRYIQKIKTKIINRDFKKLNIIY